MVVPVRVRALRWVLVLGLAIAVVGMHHLSGHGAGHTGMDAGTDVGVTAVVEPVAVECCAGHIGMAGPLPPVSSMPAVFPVPEVPAMPSMPEPSGQDLLHLCLAVLVAALGSGLLLRAVRRSPVSDPVGAFVTRTIGRRPALPPPRGVPAVLASLCVLRL
ncbi:hypothetical protein ACRAKI_25240 [Saccharothrix isguenensis]